MSTSRAFDRSAWYRLNSRMRLSSSACILGLILLSTTSLQAQPEPTPRAVEVETSTEAWFQAETFLLSNGVTVHFVRRPFAKFVAAGWAVRAGAADEDPGKTGLAHLVEHLLFQGSENIGTRDWDRENELLALADRLREQLASAHEPGLAEELSRVERNLARQQRPGELAKLWADGGILGTGALTTKDFSFYTGTFPKERFEGWLWLELDRLTNPVMRGLQREQEVVREEALQRVQGVNRGDVEVAFDRYFWGASPYARPTDGEPGEMERASRQDALGFHRKHYVAENIVLTVVGDLELDKVKRLAEAYFGRIAHNRTGEEAVAPTPSFAPTPQGKEFQAACDCRPTVRVRFASVPYSHEDTVAFDVLAAVLNGRSGRLNLRVVGSQQSAFASYATHKAQARAGTFTVVAEAAERTANSAVLKRLQSKLMDELQKLAGGDPPTDMELLRAKNILRSEVAREIKLSEVLRTRLLIDDAMGDGGRLQEWPQRLAAVSVEQLQRLTKTLLSKGGVTFFLEASSVSGSSEAGAR